MSRDVLANWAAVVAILTVLLASPMLFGTYVVVQRTNALTHFLWFGAILLLLVGALVCGLIGLVLLAG